MHQLSPDIDKENLDSTQDRSNLHGETGRCSKDDRIFVLPRWRFEELQRRKPALKAEAQKAIKSAGRSRGQRIDTGDQSIKCDCGQVEDGNDMVSPFAAIQKLLSLRVIVNMRYLRNSAASELLWLQGLWRCSNDGTASMLSMPYPS